MGASLSIVTFDIMSYQDVLICGDSVMRALGEAKAWQQQNEVLDKDMEHAFHCFIMFIEPIVQKKTGVPFSANKSPLIMICQ